MLYICQRRRRFYCRRLFLVLAAGGNRNPRFFCLIVEDHKTNLPPFRQPQRNSRRHAAAIAGSVSKARENGTISAISTIAKAKFCRHLQTIAAILEIAASDTITKR